MRLRLTIKRHELPSVQILHGIANADSTTISELIAQVNTVTPLESADGEWDLEDYIVSVGGFECVHYTHIADILKDDDEVTIRATQTVDARTRRLTGRLQISREGARLLDGLPYGSRRMRRTARPPIRIPPLKRRRLLDVDEDGDEEAVFADEMMGDGEDDDSDEDVNTDESDDNSESEDENIDDGELVEEDELEALEKDVAPVSRASLSSSKKKKRVQIQEPGENEEEFEGSRVSSDGSAEDKCSASSDDSDGSSHSSSSGSDKDHMSDTVVRPRTRVASEDSSEVSSNTTRSSGSSSGSDGSSEDDSERSSENGSGDDSKDDEVEPTKDTPRSSTVGFKSIRKPFVRASAPAPRSRLDGVVHPTLQKDILSGAQKVAPGMGKKATQVRNQRRKQNKLNKYLSGQSHHPGSIPKEMSGEVHDLANGPKKVHIPYNSQGHPQITEGVTKEIEPAASKNASHITAGVPSLEASRKDLAAQSQQPSKNFKTSSSEAHHLAKFPKTVQISHNSQGQPQTTEEVGRELETATLENTGHVTGVRGSVEDLRNRLLQDIARAMPDNKANKAASEPPVDQANRDEETASSFQQVADDTPVEHSGKAPKESTVESPPAIVSTATTGPRLRVGDATKRTLRSALGPLLTKKRKEEPQEPPFPEPPVKRRWQDVIKLQAVECGATDVDLPNPPFPFKQRWHNLPGRVFGKRKQEYMKPILEKYGVSVAGQKRKRDEEETLELEEGDDLFEEDEQVAGPNVSRGRDGTYKSGEGLNYDDEDRSRDSSTLKGPSTTPSSIADDQKDIQDGYPSEPIAVEQLSPFAMDRCRPGDFIYFKRLEISPNCSPEMTGFRTARIEDVKGDALELKYARRDVLERDDIAEERHNKFHVQTDDPVNATETSSRHLIVDFKELVEASLIKSS